ncbi:L-rhamnose mutarotase [Streptomyces montanisoli]|uniref:L-rhamnose mutarotase n=1 Tax=Streptomyces montanisoli TaxID=2798581 RepID=A0A940RXD1_9ACTN|nr:L-rhamnose mutarotase [Streptomyces montanisoli]MBP0458018.1 L-rhamnose mutarotase [Streptomyces montanisoli]
MQRVCFLLKVREDRAAEYRERHAEVWPEMLQALTASGWHNYSLFLREDGLLVGYLETEDFEAAREAMGRTGVNARWQSGMAPFFEPPEGRAGGTGPAPDEAMVPLTEIFHLA